MPSVPTYVQSEVKRYDRLLRLRWSREKKKFILERKVPRWVAHKPIRYTEKLERGWVRLPEASDKSIGYREGYIAVAYFGRLNQSLLPWLWHNDMVARNLTAKRIEELEAKYEAEAEARRMDDVNYMGGEAWDTMKHQAGERMFMSGGH